MKLHQYRGLDHSVLKFIEEHNQVPLVKLRKHFNTTSIGQLRRSIEALKYKKIVEEKNCVLTLTQKQTT